MTYKDIIRAHESTIRELRAALADIIVENEFAIEKLPRHCGKHIRSIDLAAARERKSDRESGSPSLF